MKHLKMEEKSISMIKVFDLCINRIEKKLNFSKICRLIRDFISGMSNSNYIAGRKSIKNCLKGRKNT